MKPAPFLYHRADDFDDALAVLSEMGSSARVIAGGQSLMPLLNLRLARPELLLDIARLDELRSHSRVQEQIRIGALMRQRDAELSETLQESCPLIPRALRHVGHPAIRQRGTLGGSIAHADPAAELPAVMLALDATFVVASTRGKRPVEASKFFASAFTTNLAEDELLVELVVPVSPSRSGSQILEVSRRQGDFAQAGIVATTTAATGGRLDDVRLVAFAIGSMPRRLISAEEILKGTTADDRSLAEATKALSADVTSTEDIHASASYRLEVLGTLLQRAVRAAYAEASGEGER
jgi:carbon-monoxide dehydrogenase medium subunit